MYIYIIFFLHGQASGNKPDMEERTLPTEPQSPAPYEYIFKLNQFQENMSIWLKPYSHSVFVTRVISGNYRLKVYFYAWNA